MLTVKETIENRWYSCIVIAMLLIVITNSSVNTCVYAGSSEMSRYTVHIVKRLPHNIQSFTQGLVYYEGTLYESTGLYDRSSLQKIDAETGTVQKVLPIPGFFAEGLARWEDRLIQLTWQQKTAFIYNLSDFTRLGTFQYDTEGWGLTADDRHLIMSDGTDIIYFRNPLSFEIERKIQVTLEGKPVYRINELEYVDGFIYANVWFESYIIQIDPTDGKVVGYIDATPLLQKQKPLSKDSVLNGIAYNNTTQTFYLTGKNWPTIFEVKLVRGF